MFLIHSNLGGIAKCAADGDTSRWSSMSGVRIAETDNKGYRVEATNGRVLARVDGLAPANAGDYPNVPGLSDAPNSALAAVVPSKQFGESMRAAKKIKAKKCPILETVAVQLSADVSTLGSTDLETANVAPMQNLAGRFPPCDQVFPGGTPTMTVKVNAKMLAELLSIAATFAADEHFGVTLSFFDSKGNKPIMLSSSNTEQKFSGLIVPLSKD